MKYILNFSREKIKDINLKGITDYEDKVLARKTNGNKEKIEKMTLDLNDLLILRHIYTMGKHKKRVKDTEDRSFFWIKYEALFDEYEGVLFLSKTALNARLNKYVVMGLIERKCVRNQKGTFSFFKMTGLESLIYTENKEEKHSSQQEADYTVERQVMRVNDCSIEEARAAIKIANTNGASNVVAYSTKVIKTRKQTSGNRSMQHSRKNEFHNFVQRKYTSKQFQEMEQILLRRQ